MMVVGEVKVSCIPLQMPCSLTYNPSRHLVQTLPEHLTHPALHSKKEMRRAGGSVRTVLHLQDPESRSSWKEGVDGSLVDLGLGLSRPEVESTVSVLPESYTENGKLYW